MMKLSASKRHHPHTSHNRQVYLDGVAGKQTEIHVGSPKYIKQACPLCTAPDVTTQRLVFADDVAPADIDEEGDGLSVRR